MNRKVLVAVALVVVLVGGFFIVRQLTSDDEPAARPPTLVDTADPSFFGVFEGRVPCADCERVKVRLVLSRHPETKAPTTYVLERIDVGRSNARQTTSGRWTIARGTSTDPRAEVYRLDSRAPVGFRLYQAVDHDILLFLDEDLHLRVGDAGHSYTLSRTQ